MDGIELNIDSIAHFPNFYFFRKIKNMKIICAGYPKTGSKSCSGALRVLGFKVADWLETAEFLGSTWRVGILKTVEGQTWTMIGVHTPTFEITDREIS